MNEIREYSERELMDDYYYVVAVNYCNLQDLLSCENRIGYMSSEYGWDADVYEIDDVCIVTGYRPVGNLEIKYDTAMKYEKIARSIKEGNSNWTVVKEALRGLLGIFCDNCRTAIDAGAYEM